MPRHVLAFAALALTVLVAVSAAAQTPPRTTIDGSADMREQSAAPSTRANYGRLFTKVADGGLYYLSDSGAETNLLTGGASAAAILAALLTVDGDASLLDADLLDGLSSLDYARATTTMSGASVTCAAGVGISSLVLNLACPSAGGIVIAPIVNSDADGCNITVSEASAALGCTAHVMLSSSAGGVVTMSETANVLDLDPATWSPSVGATMVLIYQDLADDRWGEVIRSNLLNEVSVSISSNLSVGNDITASNNVNALNDATVGNLLTAYRLNLSSPMIEIEGDNELDGLQTTLVITAPTADRTITFKNESGTVAFLSDIVNMSAADILASLITVDGAASGLDADLLDGISSAGFAVVAGGNTFAASNTYAANDITDADVVDTITASSYLPLAGGTMTGAITSNSRIVTSVTGTAALPSFTGSTGEGMFTGADCGTDMTCLSAAGAQVVRVKDGGLALTTASIADSFTFSTAAGGCTSGSGHHCLSVKGSGGRVGSINVASDAVASGPVLFFSWNNATDDNEVWKLKQTATGIGFVNADEDTNDGVEDATYALLMNENGDVDMGGGSGSTGCTVTAASGALTCTGAIASTMGTTTYAASIALDFSARSLDEVSLTGNVTMTTSNLVRGASYTLVVNSDASVRTFTFPAGWKFIGAASPASIAASKTGMLSLRSTSAADSGVIAQWAVQP